MNRLLSIALWWRLSFGLAGSVELRACHLASWASAGHFSRRLPFVCIMSLFVPMGVARDGFCQCAWDLAADPALATQRNFVIGRSRRSKCLLNPGGREVRVLWASDEWQNLGLT